MMGGVLPLFTQVFSLLPAPPHPTSTVRCRDPPHRGSVCDSRLKPVPQVKGVRNVAAHHSSPALSGAPLAGRFISAAGN